MERALATQSYAPNTNRPVDQAKMLSQYNYGISITGKLGEITPESTLVSIRSGNDLIPVNLSQNRFSRNQTTFSIGEYIRTHRVFYNEMTNERICSNYQSFDSYRKQLQALSVGSAIVSVNASHGPEESDSSHIILTHFKGDDNSRSNDGTGTRNVALTTEDKELQARADVNDVKWHTMNRYCLANALIAANRMVNRTLLITDVINPLALYHGLRPEMGLVYLIYVQGFEYAFMFFPDQVVALVFYRIANALEMKLRDKGESSMRRLMAQTTLLNGNTVSAETYIRSAKGMLDIASKIRYISANAGPIGSNRVKVQQAKNIFDDLNKFMENPSANIPVYNVESEFKVVGN